MKKNRLQKSGAGLLLLLILLIFLIWASIFEIDQIVRASGQVIPQYRTQVIQVADGGVLQELRVAEGELVRKGQVLALLERERASAGVDETNNRIAALEIARKRALAEASDGPLDLAYFDRSHPELVTVQQSLYRQNVDAYKKEQEVLREQMQLAREEFLLHQKLYSSGDISRVELMRAERALLDSTQKLQASKDKFRSDARKEIAKIEEEISSQRSRLQERQNVLDHTVIASPADGVVKFLRINTLGGVLRPGDELMQISPTDGQYIVEAKINPADIGQLALGQSASLRLDAFDYTIYGTLFAQLEYLSSDTLTEAGPDGRSNQLFYRARLRINIPEDSRIKPESLKPGMTVTVDLLAGRRSVLKYIFKPIARAFSGAMGQK